jgi:cytochrome P450
MFFLQQGEAWQRQRRLFHQALGPKMSKDYETVLQGYAIENAAELVKRPDDFGSCIDL